MKSAYQSHYGQDDINADAVTTGKARNLGGISGRTESTGLGVYYATRQILNHPEVTKRLGVDTGLKGKTFIVQGFGNVGYWASKFFVEEGAKLIGVAEFDGSIYNPEGINPNDLLEYKKRSKTHGVKGYPGTKSFADESAIYQPWYKLHNLVIFSFLPHFKNQLTSITLINSKLNLLFKLPMDLQLWKENVFFLIKVFNFCLISFVTQVE